ncbi:MAG TPA: hypothetical protein VFZ34_00510 [Blastocatellia bacterium]|nr:hypothetical protein [Blastocatellia bacterium]
MDDSIVNSLLPQFLQTWLQNAVWLEMLQNAMIILLIVVGFSLLYALLDLILLCRQEYKETPPRILGHSNAMHVRHRRFALQFFSTLRK